MSSRTRNSLIASALALVLAGASSASAEQTFQIGALKISHPWAPASAKNVRDAPGYLTVTNTGSVPDRLVSGSIAEAQHLEPRPLSASAGIVVQPGQTLTLRPDGDQLLFQGLYSPLEQGMVVQSILRFEKAGAGVVEFTVEGRPAGKPASGKHVRAHGGAGQGH